ncbi:MAG: signal peptidase I [Candidatus Pacebacteria bacterium]|nr:signal peptidase I [Candidatus Paceibacterota bacterium]
MDTHTTTSEHIEKKKNSGGIGELIRFAVIALLIVIPIRVFVAQPFIVSGTSMVPTFENRDYLIVDELSYRFHDPHRGDVVVFRYPKDPSKFFIKRIIGLPGETLSIDSEGIVTIVNAETPEGFILDEPYVKNIQAVSYPEIQLSENQYFTMGDNRSGSSDSRTWGTLPKKNIVGQAFLRLIPFSHASVRPGDHDFIY